MVNNVRSKMYKRAARRNYRKVRKYTPMVKNSKSVPAPVRKYVRKALAQNLELKVVEKAIFSETAIQKDGFDSNITNTGLTSTNLIPDLTFGSSSAQRVGNVINPKYLRVRCLIWANSLQQGGGGSHPNTFDYNRNAGIPSIVRIVIYSRKDNRFDATNSDIIDNTSSSTNFIDIGDAQQPYNKAKFNIHYSKTLRLAPNRWETWNTTGTLTNAGSFFTANSTKAFYPLNIKLKLPKRFTYNDSAFVPSNCAMFMAVGTIAEDNSALYSGEYRADITASSQLVYTDA